MYTSPLEKCIISKYDNVMSLLPFYLLSELKRKSFYLSYKTKNVGLNTRKKRETQ